MNDIWSILILVLIAQGLFILSVLLLSAERRKRIENRYLFLIVLVVIWFLFEFFCVRNRITIPVNLFYGTRYGSWMLLGPLTFLYFTSITNNNWKIRFLDVVHFAPFLIFWGILPIVSNESLSNRQVHYGMLAVFDHRPKTVTTFEYVYSTIFYVQFVHLGVYLLMNQLSLASYTKKIQAEFAYLSKTIWLKLLNGLMFLSLVFSSAYLYILFVSDIYSRGLDYIYVIPLGLFLYAVGYKLSGIQWLRPSRTDLRYKTSSLTAKDKQLIQKQLERIMQTEKPYLVNELRLKDLAALVSTPSHHLSQVINEIYGASFFDYINNFRTKEAKKIMEQQPDYTMLKVAFESGFNNKTSFVNAFKKFEQKTPSSYRKQVLLKSG